MTTVFVEVERMTARAHEHTDYTSAASMERVPFWMPLPGSERLSPTARRFIQDADDDIRALRLDSALDATLGLNSVAPEYTPGFIRTAELLIATSRRDHARTLLQTVIHRENLLARDDYEFELVRLQAHIESDLNLAEGLAQTILEQNLRNHFHPYVPAAIDRLDQAGQHEASLAIATAWYESEPTSRFALSYLVRCHLRQGQGQDALNALRAFRDRYDADRIWPENIVVSSLVSIASEDIDPKWLAAGPVCHGLRTKALDYAHVTSLLEFLVPAVGAPQRALLYAGLLAVNAGDHAEAQGLFQTTPAETPIESYLRSVGLERSMPSDDDQRARFAILKEIWQCLGDPQVASVAESAEIFDPPATRVTVGLHIASILRENEAFDDALRFIDELIRSGHGDAETLRLRAEIMGQSGSRNEALTSLESLVARQEAEHKYADAVETLETMMRLMPGNISLRARVVENALKIGKFDTAIEQLVAQGRLYHKAGRLNEAEAPVHRAIEIATMTSDWDKVNKLHRLLISFDPDDTRLRHSAVTNYVQYGRTSDALDQLREIVRIARKQNNLDEAIAASHQMLALNPNDPATYHQLGELLVSIHEYNQADRVYRRLANLVPDDPAVKAKRSAIAALTRARQGSQ